jgi:four helix bundle protein
VGVKSFRDLDIWKRSMGLAERTYRATETFPKGELGGLASQMRRSAVSVPSNIAEGFARSRSTEYRQFLYIARGSLAELVTQLLLAHQVGYLAKERAEEMVDEAEQIARMTSSLICRVREKLTTSD